MKNGRRLAECKRDGVLGARAPIVTQECKKRLRLDAFSFYGGRDARAPSGARASTHVFTASDARGWRMCRLRQKTLTGGLVLAYNPDDMNSVP